MHTTLAIILICVIGIVFVAWFVFEFRERARRSRISSYAHEWSQRKQDLDRWLMDDRTRSIYYPEGQWLLRAELEALEKLLREQSYSADPEDRENHRRRSLLIDKSIIMREPQSSQRA